MARLDLMYTMLILQVVIMSLWAANPRTTIYLIAMVIGAAVLTVSYCVPAQSLMVAGVAGVAVAIAVFDPGKPVVLAVCESLFVGAIFSANPLTITWFRRGWQVARQQAETQAETDELTGLLNRRGMVQRMPGLVDEARRGGGWLVVMIADLDHFKAVNDRHGHATGDQVLVAAAEALRANVRDNSLVSRIGGEEFVVALVAGTVDAGGRIAERIRAAVPVATAPTSVTVSMGVVSVAPPEVGVDEVGWALGLIDEADQLLYQAKAEGRDRVLVG